MGRVVVAGGRVAVAGGTVAVVVGLLAVAAGCEAGTESGSRPGAEYRTRDSAGITIVENSGVPAEGERWSLVPEPVLSIGGPSAPVPAMFTVVTTAARLRDGTIVVLENSTSELRFFDQEGRHLRTAGGVGEGPGEFVGATGFVRLAGDSLLVDAGVRHLLFGPGGEYIRQTRIDVLRYFSGERTVSCLPHNLLADGSLAVCEFVSGERPPIGGPDPTAQYLRVASDGSETGLGYYWYRLGVLREDSWAASGGSPPIVAIAPNPEYSIEVWSLEGELTRIIRRLDARRPPTDEEGDAALEALLALYTDETLTDLGVDPEQAKEPPDLVPAVFGLTVGATGDVWVRRKPFVQLHDETIFDVFDEEGRYRGEVRYAGYYWLYEVGEDYVLGAWLDELGVPYIVLHRLSRG